MDSLLIRCHNCNKEGINYARCSKCKVAYYCSRGCQVTNWCLHKHICKSPPTTYAKRSNFDSYGNGLFANVDIKKGFIIEEFKGKLCKPGDVVTNNRSNVQFADSSILQCASDNLASFANDGINFPTEHRHLMATLKSDKPFYERHPGTIINASIEIKHNEHRAFLIADMDIKKDTEIFCHYGFTYWFLQELQRGFSFEKEIEINGMPKNVFTYPSFSAYIKEFYPTNVGFKVNPYKDHFDIIIHTDDSRVILMEIPDYFKHVRKMKL